MNKEETLKYIADKWDLNLNNWDTTKGARTDAYFGEYSPVRIPNTERFGSLPELFRELGFKEGAEIGTAEGTYAKAICEGVPGVKLHCVDSWEKYEGYNDFRETYYEPAERKTREKLAPYNCNIIKKYSLDAANDFEKESLDFVYIDANHDVRHVIEDIDEWKKKVRPGGIVSGHDWAESRRMWRYLQVVPALHAYTWAWRIKPWFVLGRDDRIPGEQRQRYRSWFFVV